MIEYYRIPLRIDSLIAKNELDKCKDIGESIYQNIHLILMTSFGEYRPDRTYGCSLWENDFENIVSINKWKEEMKFHIQDVIERHEPRLKNVKGEAEITETELGIDKRSKIQRIKKMVEVSVTGRISVSNEPFHCIDRLYVSPLSLD